VNSFAPSSSPRTDAQQLFAETFRKQIAALESGHAHYRVPKTRGLYERHPSMAYHFKPEMFVQLGGATDFFFPDQKFTLEANEICIMPRGVPHGEIARATKTSFENVVVCFYNDTVAIHIARELLPGKPRVDEIFFYTTEFYDSLVAYLDNIAELRLYGNKAGSTATKGLLLAEFSLLLELVEERAPARYSDTDRVFRCQWLIRNNLDDATLSVESLAAELRCTPRYLSKFFHQEVGERIIDQIARLRLRNAIEALEASQLSIKEIAIACGYSDANYFSRVFRRATGKSPHDYRSDRQRVACVVEKQPKVVYYEKEEYGFGLAPQVMAAAKIKMPE
jgi:AraC-like DNA-binding protein